MEAAIQINEGQKRDLSVEVAQIAIKLGWLVIAMKANDDGPAPEILEGITAELDALVEPIAQMRMEVRHG